MPFMYVCVARAHDLSVISDARLVKITTSGLGISENSRYSRLVDLVVLAIFSANILRNTRVVIYF